MSGWLDGVTKVFRSRRRESQRQRGQRGREEKAMLSQKQRAVTVMLLALKEEEGVSSQGKPF